MQVISFHADEVSDAVKEACMNLLASLCASSKKGKEVVSGTDDCSSCITFASDCISSHAKLYNDSTSTESEGDLLDVMVEKPSISLPTPIEIGDCNIVLLSITFLSSIVRAKLSRMEVIKNNELKEALQIMLENSPSYAMKFAITSFFAALARYAKDFTNEESYYSVQNMSSMLLSSFNPKKSKQGARFSSSESSTPLFGDFSAMHHYNDNLVLATSCTAFEHMLPYMPHDLVQDVLEDLLQKFSDMIKYEMKTTKKIAVKTRNSGLLVCNISSILLQCTTRIEYQTIIKNESVLSDLLRLILLNPGEKLVEGKKDSLDDIHARETEKTNWYCCVAHCMQCLAVLSVEPLDIGETKTWDDIMARVESEIQVVRKGRRTTTSLRMAVDTAPKNKVTQLSMTVALNNYLNGNFDPASIVAARKIIDNLDLNSK
jgi:hypothetical protein